MSTESLKLVLVGEVDHGKSSVVGRLLADTGTIAQNRIDHVKMICEKQGKEFEYAFLMDAFEEEQRQGITIDVSHIQFSTDKRLYKLIDAPGHYEFLKNMISGSSNAQAAILLIDAKEGVREQSRRHSYLLKLLGINNIMVAINKMDLVDYKESVYNKIIEKHGQYLTELGLTAHFYIPMSAKVGDNIAKSSTQTDWYKGSHLSRSP